jgi:hypothetical protein
LKLPATLQIRKVKVRRWHWNGTGMKRNTRKLDTKITHKKQFTNGLKNGIRNRHREGSIRKSI